jgi:hypothetical protein
LWLVAVAVVVVQAAQVVVVALGVIEQVQVLLLT